jgi:lipoyl-dependent peroxiredoxin
MLPQPHKLAAQTRRPRKKIMMRMASAIWKAGLKEGSGIISTESGVLKEAPYSVNLDFPGQPVTNPEELLAAAVASSFSIALSVELEKACLIPESIRLAAGLMMGESQNGWVITQIHLEVTVKLVKEDLEKFEIAAKAAKDNCVISRLLSTKITMDAKLESWRSFGEIERQSGSIPLGKRLVTISLEKKNGAVE